MAVKICPECGGKVAESRDVCIHCGHIFAPVEEKVQCPECEEWVVKTPEGYCPVCGHRFEESASAPASAPVGSNPFPSSEMPVFGGEAIETFGFADMTPLQEEVVKLEPIPSGGYKAIGVNDPYVQHISIPEGVRVVAKRAFVGLEYLETVDFPSSVQIIEDEAFADCPHLDIEAPNTVRHIGKDAFRGSKAEKRRAEEEQKRREEEARLAAEQEKKRKEEEEQRRKEEQKRREEEKKRREEEELLKAGFKLENNVLVSYTGTDAEVIIPSSVVSIGEEAFRGNKTMKKLIFPKDCKVTSIERRAFNECEELISVEIPACVTKIGRKAFLNDKKLQRITFPQGSKLTELGYAAIARCDSLTRITIPKGVKVLEGYVLCENVNMESIQFASDCKLTSIEERAFDSCENLTSITIPEGVEKIGDCVFDGCYNLTSIEIPSTVTEIGALGVTAGLASISVAEDNPRYCALGNCLCDRETLAVLKGCADSSIPDGIVEIGTYAFACSDINALKLPNTVKTIAEGAFRWCSELRVVHYGLYFCGVETIGDYAFSETAITFIHFPESLTSIGKQAFYTEDENHKLVQIYYAGRKDDWMDIEKGEDWADTDAIEEISCKNGKLKNWQY